jgi:membrane protein DedA with SNARE-associated domain
MDLSFYGMDLTVWLSHYGSFALFVLLGMGIFGLPVPEETLMVLAGILMNEGNLPLFQTIVAAYAGTLCGITVSYFLGRTAGVSIIKEYGKWMPMHSRHIQKTQTWFARFSKWTLLIGYLIPGLRHFTGIFAGSAAMQFKEFALFAYSGAFLWVSIFLSIGYFFGPYWLSLYAAVFQNLEMAMEILSAVVILLFIAYFIYRAKSTK